MSESLTSETVVKSHTGEKITVEIDSDGDLLLEGEYGTRLYVARKSLRLLRDFLNRVDL